MENILRFLQHIRTYKCGLILQMQGNGDITNSMCMLLGSKNVGGLRKAGGYAPHPNTFPVSEDGDHEILRFLKLASCLNLPLAGSDLEFPLLPQERHRASLIIKDAGIKDGEYVCFILEPATAAVDGLQRILLWSPTPLPELATTLS